MSANMIFNENQHEWIKFHVDQEHEIHESFFLMMNIFLQIWQEIMLDNITIMVLFTFTYYYIYVFIILFTTNTLENVFTMFGIM